METEATLYPDPLLEAAHHAWLPALKRGILLAQEGENEAAITAFSEAIRISAAFHPRFHFLESGLQTELAIYLLNQEKWDDAAKHFKRAVFLDHTNEPALQGQNLAASQRLEVLPAYDRAATTLMDWLGGASPPTLHHEHLLSLRAQARTAEGNMKTRLYLELLEKCEEAHQHYHRLASLPWRWRAELFRKQNQIELAENDLRRSRDLDPLSRGALLPA